MSAPLRPAGAGDVPALQRFVAGLSRTTRLQRFFAPLRELPGPLVQALQRGDPAQRFFVAEHGGEPIGLGQLAIDADGGELALVVADDWQGRGVGRALLARLVDEARQLGLPALRLETLVDNHAMQALARRAGFEWQPHPEDPDLLLGRRPLTARAARRAGPLEALAGVALRLWLRPAGQAEGRGTA